MDLLNQNEKKKKKGKKKGIQLILKKQWWWNKTWPYKNSYHSYNGDNENDNGKDTEW